MKSWRLSANSLLLPIAEWYTVILMLETPTSNGAVTTIYTLLRAAIITGELPGGTPLRQAAIGARYGVSKIPVREALQQLEAQGFVTLYPGRGAVVAALSAEEAEEIYLMRIGLEPILLTRSVPNLTPLDFARADVTLHVVNTMAGLTAADWHKLDGEFHAILYGAAPLPRIQREVRTLRGNLARYFAVFQTLGNDFRALGTAEHRRILNACQAGDIALARDLLVAHLERSSAELVAAIERKLD